MTARTISKICVVNGCSDFVGRHSGYDMCSRHYQAEYIRRKPLCLVPECTRNQHAKGICPAHLQQGRRDPQFQVFLCGLFIERDAETMFWARVDKTPGQGPKGECWEWQGYRDEHGYGKIGFQNTTWRSHRLTWFYLFNEVPNVVCHSCDNPPCCNPAHLSNGTHAQNSAEAWERNRISLGEARRNATITNATARQIKQLLQTDMDKTTIAKEVGATYHHVWRIAKGIDWKHVTIDGGSV